MKSYLAAFFAVAAVVSASAFATQEEYKKCLKQCATLPMTPEEKIACPKFCEYFLEKD